MFGEVQLLHGRPTLGIENNEQSYYRTQNLNDTGAGGKRVHTPPPAPAIGTFDCLDALDSSEPIGAFVISQFLAGSSDDNHRRFFAR
jgi:hypothetical protein